ncbi:hypothetical protein TIFTF001_044861 [Ficus carica]|uniref:Carboxypeptidase n=1 Tax=Ficus carica TaxID=3494 RepID=A0AA87ZHX7_FICCA|nr:hypothetical protein TIFTF001_044861 [Ficus carica]
MARTSLIITYRVVLVCLIWLFMSLGPTQSAPESALITQFPGFSGTIPSKHYSGYVTVDQNHGRNLFYYFVESERNPSEDPLVLWLNGGPGCSSFYGFINEHGPFNFEKAKTKGSLPQLHLNPYSWSKVSNIIYLDSPAGVGYSYSKNQSDYITGDRKTASDSHTFLLKWFELYPEFLSNPFFISGESYAGVYVPTLTYEVAKGIEAGITPIINLKGYMVGNGVTDDEFDGNALIPFVHGMGLISDDLFQEVNTECGGKYYSNLSASCESKLAKVDRDIEGVNIYNILEPCYDSLPASFRRLGETEGPLAVRTSLAVRTRMFGRAWPLRAPVREGIVPTWPKFLSSISIPCIDVEVATTWLNNETVRKALHVAEESLVGSWEFMTDRISFYHDAGSMIPYHRNLTTGGYRALIFSGDHDMCVPFTGSEAWTRSLGYQILDEWRPWFSNGQVAGYTQGYDHNLTFLTVKGSGHTVPEYKPREAFELYSRFLAGKPL